MPKLPVNPTDNNGFVDCPMAVDSQNNSPVCITLIFISSGFEEPHHADNILLAYWAFGHLFAAIDAACHVATFQNYAFDWSIPTNLAQLFFA